MKALSFISLNKLGLNKMGKLVVICPFNWEPPHRGLSISLFIKDFVSKRLL